jgi:hypothetical protein
MAPGVARMLACDCVVRPLLEAVLFEADAQREGS